MSSACLMCLMAFTVSIDGTERTIATYEGNTVNWLETSAQIWVRNGKSSISNTNRQKVMLPEC